MRARSLSCSETYQPSSTGQGKFCFVIAFYWSLYYIKRWYEYFESVIKPHIAKHFKKRIQLHCFWLQFLTFVKPWANSGLPYQPLKIFRFGVYSTTRILFQRAYNREKTFDLMVKTAFSAHHPPMHAKYVEYW